jgi:DeoR/GlpR family transcriptional regulator of sugar metabolism
VILLGGILDADGFSVRGPIALENLNDLRVSKAFISCSGITPEEGLTEVDLFESQLKKAVVQTAGQVYALVDSHKFGKVDLAPFVHLERLTHLFTDCGLSAEWEDRLKQTGLDFTVCERVFASEPPADITRSHR